MSFANLPDIVLLKIFEYLPFEDGVRIGRANRRLHEISRIILSKTKYLNLKDPKFERLTLNGLASLVNLCKGNLETVILSERRQLAKAFSAFTCPRLVTLDMDLVKCGANVFGALMKNNENLERLIWNADKPLMKYPRGVVSENLLKLELQRCDDDSLAALSGRCPNLQELHVDMLFSNNSKIFDQFFANSSKLETVRFEMSLRVHFEWLIHFWRLPSLRNLEFGTTYFDSVSSENPFLVKISESFPQLQKLRLPFMDVTNTGIRALAALPNLRRLELDCREESEIDASVEKLAKCGKLEELILDHGILSTATFVKLFRFCPYLHYLHVDKVADIAATDALIELVRQLGSLPGQETTFVLECDFFGVDHKRIRDVLDEIANAGGRRILFN